MKTEIKEILDYMEGAEEILRLREQVKNLDAQNPEALQDMLDSLYALTSQVDVQDQQCLGCYDLFLGCVCHEQEDYPRAAVYLKQALPKLRGSKNNRAVAHWLLSVNYSSSKEYDKARKELIKAERLSKVRINAMQEKVNAKIRDMFNDPIFDQVLPDPKLKISRSIISDAAISEVPVPEKKSISI